MKRRDKKPLQRLETRQEGVEAAHELELRSAYLHLSAEEQEAVRQGIDAAQVGSFAPQDEMDEFYRLLRDS